MRTTKSGLKARSKVAGGSRHQPAESETPFSYQMKSTAIQQLTPSCHLLTPTDNAPPDAAGVLLLRQPTTLRPGRFAFSILAHNLPEPGDLGPYNSYQGLLYIPEIITWVFALHPTPESPPTWAGTFTESTLNPAPNGIAQVRPYHTATNATGNALLQGDLR